MFDCPDSCKWHWGHYTSVAEVLHFSNSLLNFVSRQTMIAALAGLRMDFYLYLAVYSHFYQLHKS